MSLFFSKKVFFIVSLYIPLLHCAYSQEVFLGNKAVVTVPVADTATKSLAFLTHGKSLEQVYTTLPCSPATGPSSCARAHQFLFNEIVAVTQEAGDEVECKVNNVFYEDPLNIPISSFWTLKKYIALLKNTKNTAVPEPYALDCKQVLDAPNVLTLTLPWHDQVTEKTYSVGTRFVRVKERDTAHEYGVKLNAVLTDGNLEAIVSMVPKDSAIIVHGLTFQERQKVFVSVLKKWVSSLAVIAYVWGGGSCIKTYKDADFSLASEKRGDDDLTYWTRPNDGIPHSGFDCSGLVLRAAQIAGLPYFFKNTATLAHNIGELKSTEELEEGDLVFYQGHVMIVSDLANNEIIEAIGYSSGYGKVHALTLAKAFEGITTYADLTAAYFAKRPLKRLKRDGTIARELPTFKLLKLQNIGL
ncbi:C40 family peptidase [Candidatus Dependentiae bacterium]|nr:C40 family peptidase [Candidatus Dependentiae bacterium]